MQIPNLPHDNLYKFIAFSGLAILIGINYLFYSMESDVLALLLEKNVNQWKVDAEEKAVRKAMIDLLEADDKLIAEGEEERRNRHKEKIDNLLQRYRENRDNGLDQMGKEVQVDIAFQRFDKVRWLYWVATAIGILFMVVGVTLWYKRIQRPQDLLMMKETGSSS